MSHGNIEQGNQETKGCDKPPFHVVHFFRCHIFRHFLRFIFSLHRCAITAAFHRMDNIRRAKGIVVILHHHTVLEQVYVDTLDTFQLADAFLHMGRAGRTGHTRHVKFLFHGISSLFQYFAQHSHQFIYLFFLFGIGGGCYHTTL